VERRVRARGRRRADRSDRVDRDHAAARCAETPGLRGGERKPRQRRYGSCLPRRVSRSCPARSRLGGLAAVRVERGRRDRDRPVVGFLRPRFGNGSTILRSR
jgi:hypothetical protein